MRANLQSYFHNSPLRGILLLALFIRLLPLFFSEGYYAHDDHFLVIEVAQHWVDGVDPEQWFTSFEETKSGRSILYPGVHYMLFKGFEQIGLEDGKAKMFIVRLIHTFYSLLIVYFGFKITNHLSGEKVAKSVGIMMAVFWLFPFVGVRNLVEFVSAVPLLAAGWVFIRKNKNSVIAGVIAGVLIGVAFSLRYQAVLVGAGFGLAILIQRKHHLAIGSLIGFVVWVGLFHGLGEYIITGVPFGKIIFYVNYNFVHSESYFKQPWYDFILLSVGFMLPPLGVLLFVQTVKQWREYLVLVLGLAVFFVLHSLFPNKQERFIFTIMPIFVTVGWAGWVTLKGNEWWHRHVKLRSWLVYVFLGLNTILLVMTSIWSTKKSRVEASYFIRNYPSCETIVIMNPEADGTTRIPDFYAGHLFNYLEINKGTTLEDWYWMLEETKSKPELLFLEIEPWREQDENDIQSVQSFFSEAKLVTRIYGDQMDAWRFKANKNVKNFEYLVFEI